MNRMKSTRLKLNKKVVTLAGVTLLLLGAVAANLLIGREADKENDALEASAGGDVALSAQATYFDAFRRERTETREQEILYIDTIIEQGADAETLADAQAQKLAIVDAMEKEMTIESLLKAKGFADAAVTLHEGSVNVVLSAETLTDEQVAQVLDIILRETDAGAEDVKITTAQ